MHPPLHGADANINSTQSADVNVNTEVSSAASTDVNIKFQQIIRKCGCEYSLHLYSGPFPTWLPHSQKQTNQSMWLSARFKLRAGSRFFFCLNFHMKNIQQYL